MPFEFYEFFRDLWEGFIHLTDFIPIDLILVMAIVYMFGRFVWVMQRKTRVWDNFSRSLIAVFLGIGLVFAYVAFGILTDPFPGQIAVLWSIRIFILVSITWCQFELNKELKKVPSILFVRDRQWVHRRINNIEIIRALLMSHDDTPPGLIPALDAELTEMYRFKEVVWEDDKKRGIKAEPEWTKNPFYVESHNHTTKDPRSDNYATLMEHEYLATPGDDYPGQGGNKSL